jgi:hypothetical protein
MSRLFILALAGVAIWLGFRAIGRRSRQAVDALREAESAVAKRAPVTLEKDPKTGVYRPAKAGE